MISDLHSYQNDVSFIAHSINRQFSNTAHKLYLKELNQIGK